MGFPDQQISWPVPLIYLNPITNPIFTHNLEKPGSKLSPTNLQPQIDFTASYSGLNLPWQSTTKIVSCEGAL